MQLQDTTAPMSPAERSLVDRVKAHNPATDKLDDLAAGHGFRLAPSPGWSDALPRGAYQTYARAKGNTLTVLRNVSTQDTLPPWHLVTDDLGHFDLWPAEIEDEDRPISGAAVFACAATGIVILLLIVWGLTLSGVIKW